MNSLLEEYETFLKFKTKTTAYNKVLEDTIKEKCPDLYLQESDIVELQNEVDELEAKKNETARLTEQSLVEYKELEEQLELLKVAQD